MSFNGDLYPTAGADVVMTTKGDMVDYNTARQRLGIGSTNQVLQVKSGLPSWETLATADSRLEQLAHADTTDATTDSVALTFSSIDLNDYSSLMLEFGGVGVGALDIELLIGAVTSGYRYCYDKSVTGTWTNVNATGQSEIKMADLGAGDWFYGIANISAIEQNEGVDQYAFNWKVNAFSTDQWIGGGFTSSGSVDITTVTLQTSASYFAEHCRFNLMGLNRA